MRFSGPTPNERLLEADVEDAPDSSVPSQPNPQAENPEQHQNQTNGSAQASSTLVKLSGLEAKHVGAPIRSGVFVLANTLLGAGMLGLPHAFALCGALTGSIMLVCFAGCGILGLHLLAEAADLSGRPASFKSVADAALPGCSVLFELAIAIKCFGVAASYLIVVGDSVPKAVDAFGLNGVWGKRRLWVLVAVAVAGPLAFMKR
eukprot:3527560-Pleurochrysis_carterae.AAC.1